MTFDPAGVPDSAGRFGEFGGRYVPEALMGALDELEKEWDAARADSGWLEELQALRAAVVGRPTPLYEAKRFSERAGARVWLKREDLAHTGAHKINNTIGQVLLAVRMGKRRIIAETGAGQHGVATATAAAYFGLPCVVYMGAVDVRRRLCRVAEIEGHSEDASQPELANDLHVVGPSGLGADVGDFDHTVTRLCLQAGTLVEPCLHLVDLPR